MSKQYQKRSTGSDWNRIEPNDIYINEKSAKYGNAIIAVRKWNGTKMVSYRAGHPIEKVHPLTRIIIQNGGISKQINLNTARVYQYLEEKSSAGEIFIQPFTFNKCPNDAYKVKISDLTLFANTEEHPIAGMVGVA
jgi:hypothetical protein